MGHLRLRKDGTRVLLRNLTSGRVLSMDWGLAIRLSTAIRECRAASIRGDDLCSVTLHGNLSVTAEENSVVLLVNGLVDLLLPLDVANRVWMALLQLARQAEEDVKAECVISDQALLNRKGFPIGVTDDPRKQKAAFREAQFLRTPVRKIGGVESVSRAGAPGLITHPPEGRLFPAGIVPARFCRGQK